MNESCRPLELSQIMHKPAGYSVMTSSCSYSCSKQTAVIWYRALFKCFWTCIAACRWQTLVAHKLAGAWAFESLSISHFSSDKLSNLSQAKYGSKPEQWKIDEDCKFSEASCIRQDIDYIGRLTFKDLN